MLHKETVRYPSPDEGALDEKVDAILNTLREWHNEDGHDFAFEWCDKEPCKRLREYVNAWV